MSSGARRQSPSDRDRILSETVRALSERTDDEFSRAVCPGGLDPSEVMEWVERARKLVLYQCDRSALRSEVPALVERLEGLLEQVELPSGKAATDIALAWAADLPGLRNQVAADVQAAFDGDPAARSLAEVVASYPSVRALAVHRIAHKLYQLGVPMLPRIMSETAHDRTGIDIHPGATLGKSFFIDHGTGVVIGETAEIGDRVRLYQGVTVGAASLRDRAELAGRKRHPTIEDDVIVYAGATILGGDTVIGQGSVIGGNVWLTESVPRFSRVVAEPARQLVRKRDEDDRSSQLRWEM